MNFRLLKYVLPFSICLVGILIPIIPPVIVSMLQNKHVDVFGQFRPINLYFVTIMPFIILSVIAWFSCMIKYSEISALKRWALIIMVLTVLIFFFDRFLKHDVLPIIPYGLLLIAIGLSFSRQNITGPLIIKRLIGVMVSFVAIVSWSLAVSMPTAWGLAAYWFMLCSPIVLLVTYFIGGSIGYLIARSIFPHIEEKVAYKLEGVFDSRNDTGGKS